MYSGLFINLFLYSCYFLFTVFYTLAFGYLILRLISLYTKKKVVFTPNKIILSFFIGISFIIAVVQNISRFFLVKTAAKGLLILFGLIVLVFIWDIIKQKLTFKKNSLFLLIPFVLTYIFGGILVYQNKTITINGVINNDAFYYIPIEEYYKNNKLITTEIDPNTTLDQVNSLPQLTYQDSIRTGVSLLNSTISYTNHTLSYKYLLISKVFAVLLILLSSIYLISFVSDRKQNYLLTVILGVIPILTPLFARNFFDDFLAFLYGLPFLLILYAYTYKTLKAEKSSKYKDFIILGILASGFITLYIDLVPILALGICLLSIRFIPKLSKNRNYYFKGFTLSFVIAVFFNIDAVIRAYKFLKELNQASSVAGVIDNNRIYKLLIGQENLYLGEKILSNNIINLLNLTLILLFSLFIFVIIKKKNFSKIYYLLSFWGASGIFLIYTWFKLKYEYGLVRIAGVFGFTTIILFSSIIILFIKSIKNKVLKYTPMLLLASLAFVFISTNIHTIKYYSSSTIKTSLEEETFFFMIKNLPKKGTIKIVGTEFVGQPVEYEHEATYLTRYLSQAPSTNILNPLSYFKNNMLEDHFDRNEYTHVISNFDMKGMSQNPALFNTTLEKKRNYYVYSTDNNLVVPEGKEFFQMESDNNGNYWFWTQNYVTFEVFSKKENAYLEYYIDSFGPERTVETLLNGQSYVSLRENPGFERRTVGLPLKQGPNIITLKTPEACLSPGADPRLLCMRIINPRVVTN